MLVKQLPRFAALKILLLWFCLWPGLVLAQSAIDFSAVLGAAHLAGAAYQSESQIRQAVQAEGYQLSEYQVIPEIELGYFIATDEQKKKQVVVLRGTSNAENALLDISVKLVHDQYTGLYLHEGFAYSAYQVFQRIRHQLKKTYRIETTGHSLGGAVALILAKYLDTDGFNIDRVITFGQPKVTNFEGAKDFEHLNLIRVVTPLDMVPLTPPFDPVEMATGNINIYWHAGTEVLLLEGNRYAILQGMQSMMRATGFSQQDIAGQALSHHSMDYYLQLLRDKNTHAQQVPFESGFNLFKLFGH
jgi:hypothetical protein